MIRVYAPGPLMLLGVNLGLSSSWGKETALYRLLEEIISTPPGYTYIGLSRCRKLTGKCTSISFCFANNGNLYFDHGGPDESYIVWSSHRDGEVGDGDLYVSYHQEDGSWGEPINLGTAINTSSQERFPSISPDGKYLFFARHTDNNTYSDIYWVDAGIIQSTRNLENQGTQ